MTAQDLLIVAPDRVEVAELVELFPDLTTRYELRIDRRWRHAPESDGDETRRQDRRRHDISERLRRDGWVVVPATQRSV